MVLPMTPPGYVVGYRVKGPTGYGEVWSISPDLDTARAQQMACFTYLNQRAVVWIKPENSPYCVGEVLA